MLGFSSLLHPSPWLNRTIGVDSYNKHCGPFSPLFFSCGIVCVLVLIVNKFAKRRSTSEIRLEKSYTSEIRNICVQEYLWFSEIHPLARI